MPENRSKTGRIGKAIRDGNVQETDLDDVFEVFADVCNTDEILLFTLKNYTESFQFYFDDYSAAIEFENGRCRTEKGQIRLPDVTFRIRTKIALDILNGRVYSAVAHMNGDIDYTGYKDGAIRFIAILESVLDGAASAADAAGKAGD